MSAAVSNSPAADVDRLAGVVERVTFHNEQNSFCVLRLKVKGKRVDRRWSKLKEGLMRPGPAA